MKVEFYFDPSCPWTWMTSRWVCEVASTRGIEVTWQTYSLKVKNADNPNLPEIYRELQAAQWPALRIIQAARAHHGNDAVGRLYTQLGALIHHDGDRHLAGLAAAVEAAGLPAEILAEGDNPAWDESITASTDAARALVGDDVGIPIAVFEGARATYFGPVMSPAPTGQDALDLWDALQTLSRLDGVYEIKRSRNVGPQFGPRPA